MEITNMKPVENGKVKARFSLKTQEGFLIPDFRLVLGEYGMFCGWPNTKDREGKYNPVVVPSAEGLKKAVESLAEEAFLQMPKEGVKK